MTHSSHRTSGRIAHPPWAATARLPFVSWLLALALLGMAANAAASCGSAFCSINTDWQALGLGVQRGWRLKVQYEFIDQDQLRRGSDDVSHAEPDAEHEEVRTVNRNWLATADYGIDDHWGVLAYLLRYSKHFGAIIYVFSNYFALN